MCHRSSRKMNSVILILSVVIIKCPYRLVFLLFACCSGVLCGECVDFINIQPEKKASDGGSVAGMWCEWNEGTTA